DLKQLIDNDPDQQMQFLAIQLVSALRDGSVDTAMPRLLELSSQLARQPLQGNEEDEILGDPSRKCNLDSWLAARCADLARLAEEKGKLEEIKATLKEHLETKLLGSSQVLLRLVEHFRPLGAEELVLSLADRFIREENHIVAERMLLGSLRPESVLLGSDDAFSTKLAQSLCRVYANARFGKDALAVLERLRGNVDDETIAMLEKQAESGIDPGGDALAVEGSVSLDWQNNSIPGAARISTSMKLVETANLGGNTFAGWSVLNLSGASFLQKPLGEQQRFAIEMRRGLDHRATISGGLLLLERAGQISAINLFAIRENRITDATLWKRDFGSEGKSVSQPRSAQMPLGDSIRLYPTNNLINSETSEFRVGPVLGDRVLVLQAGDLLSIRATDGKTIWRNSNAPTKGHMVADDGRVALICNRRDASTKSLFSLADGRSLEESEWLLGKAWTTAGKHVLTYDEEENGSRVRVRLVNPFNEEVILETTSNSNRPSNDSRGLGRVLQDRYLVLFDGDGKLTVWDLIKGIELCSRETGAMPKLETMRAMHLNGRILVLAANEIKRFTARDMNTRAGDTHHSVHRMISISTETGDLQWQREFEQPWGCTIHQPFASPVIAMTRYKSVFSANRSPNIQMDVEMLRLSDGKTIHQILERSLGPRNSSLATRLLIQPQANRVLAQIGTETLIYQFTEKALETDDDTDSEESESEGTDTETPGEPNEGEDEERQ
ncbi:MAG: PQQ-binding-like beta-propeller repeat protein, partial [Planctomycetota bacterium]